MNEFIHLHCHTQYSLLDGASDIGKMMDKAVADGQKGVAMTDHGNMFGAFKFVSEAKKRNIKPIVGCEFYLVADRTKQSFQKSIGERDVRHHQLMLAKNATGYANLSKLCSLGFIEGAYGKFPRIDKELLVKYAEGVIATSCCIGAIIPQLILQGKEEEAEKELQWWLDLFGEDYYIELQRHRGLENIDVGGVPTGVSQEYINQVLLKFAKKYNVEVICTNDSHYVEEEDNFPHDILLCVNTGSKVDDEKRFRFSSSDFYFKTQQEMANIFKDVPQSLETTMKIYDKIEVLELARDVILPNFPLPEGFETQADFLRHLVYEGALVRYGEITEEVRERLDMELGVITDMGFEGYFLITQDFIHEARRMDVAVGPGRGSAAGSAVAYCLTITDIDPIKYRLLFERFLNPERISMPDIDIDFDDEGRQRVIDYVVDKYGKSQVAQIITFGTMKARSAIRDVARVLELPLSEADGMAKLVPSRQGKSPSLGKVVSSNFKELKSDWPSEEFQQIEQLHNYINHDNLASSTLMNAAKLEGTIRNSGIHAAGVIIAPDDITNYIPVCTAKDADLLVTQFDGSVVESAGMLKMDFLGLKTLSVIKTCINIIVRRYGESARIIPSDIPLDDEKTYELFQNGDTVGIFQFESEGMQKHLRDLKPTNIEDLIAMNALYRPGPMDNIPTFINRKFGREKVTYPHPSMEPILENTNGIMVYQEQIMETARVVGNYSLGMADMLRRAMGKKKVKEMEKHKGLFVKGAAENNISEEKALEIYEIMFKFANYGFNRSHAAAYSVVAFHTAYLKAHYPAEFMSAILTHSKNNLEKLTFFLRECKRMKLNVLGPDVNESEMNFTVNELGHVRFGLSALKGVGEGPVTELVENRERDGVFKSVFDMMRRLNLRTINKKCMESLVKGGALDLFETVRGNYFAPSDKYDTYVEHLLRYGNVYQKQIVETANSLFGASAEIMIPEPPPPPHTPWPLIKKLTEEREVAGIYISGHPLDEYRMVSEHFTTCALDETLLRPNAAAKVVAIVTAANHGTDSRGNGRVFATLQDYTSSIEVSLWRDDYQKFKHLMEVGQCLYIRGVYEPRWRGAEQWAFNIKDASLLAEIEESVVNELKLKLRLDQLNQKMVDDIKKIISEFKGKNALKLEIADMEERLMLPMYSRSYKIVANNKLIERLEELNIQYSLE